VPENDPLANTHFNSCDPLIDGGDLPAAAAGAIEQRGGDNGYGMVKSSHVVFSALEALDAAPPNNGPPMPVRWQTVELSGSHSGGDCALRRYAALKILPLCAVRDIKRISADASARLEVGLRAQVLKPPPAPTGSP